MKQEDLDYFKKHLTDWLDQLLDQSKASASELRNSAAAADLIDRAIQENNRSQMLRIKDREYKLIKKIKLALDNIESGNYGICEMCSEDIPIARLKARPVTTYCIRCKTKMEASEKVREK